MSAAGKLAGRVAVITGGSTGIGLEAAKLFIAEGAFVYVTGRHPSKLDAAVAVLGAAARGVQGDIASAPDRARLFQAIESDGRRIDILFANAGVGEATVIGSISEEQFDHIVGVNLKGTLFTLQDALPLLNDGASVIFTGSIAGIKGFPELVVYSATKAALRSLTRTCAAGLRDRQIRVNLLSPGTTDTAIIAAMPPEYKQALAEAALARRLADPIEIARVALFLATDDSSYVNGSELFADGGAAQV